MADRNSPVGGATAGTGRRRFLRSIGALGGVGMAGCAGRAAAARSQEGIVRVAYNPYDGVEWSDVSHHKCEFHNHVRGRMDEPADIVDLYHELGYTVYAVAGEGDSRMLWPWTEFSDVDDSFEDRTPEELGVVAFPGCEFQISEHVLSLFSTLTHADVDAGAIDDRWEQSHRIVDRTDHYVPDDVGGLAVVAHPALYYVNPYTAWERYRPDFETRTREAGMVGLEVFNRGAILDRDAVLWDALLTEFAPERMIWGFGVDDPSEYVLGTDVDVNWTTVLLDESEFDPDDQSGSRRAAASAMTAGRTLLHQRDQWDPDEEDPAIVPQVHSIDVEDTGGEISIDASEYDTLEWVSGGDVVSTNETMAPSPDDGPYVRAHLTNDRGGETSTQPFGLTQE